MLQKTQSAQRPEAIEISLLPNGQHQVYIRKNITEEILTADDGEGYICYNADEACAISVEPVTKEEILLGFDTYFNICACWRPDLAEIQKEYTAAVQKMLDGAAQAKGYDDIFTAASYANSTDPEFKAEAEAFIAWRDATWRKCYAILDEITLGKREYLPDIEEVMAELPENPFK